MATQPNEIASIENSLPIEGSATFTEEASKGVRKAPTVTTSRVILFTEFGFSMKNFYQEKAEEMKVRPVNKQ